MNAHGAEFFGLPVSPTGRPRRAARLEGVRTRGSLRARARAWGIQALRRSTVRLDDRLKRAVDIVGAGLLLLVLSPLLALIAVAIKLDDGGDVLFWQARVGRFGRHFAFPKFRSMRPDAEALKTTLIAHNQHGDRGITFKIKGDPRITGVGRVLRRFSLDELPQLWCVLRGDMSLVGPRPPVPSEVERYCLRARRRLEAWPGLTCIWQVSGRSELDFERQLALDVEYIEQRSLWLDAVLLVRTIPAVLSGRGAY